MPFIVGLMKFCTALFAEVVCIYLLAYQHTIEHCIIHFVALEVVVEVPKFYFESMKENEKLFEMFEHPMHITKRGKDI